MGWLEKLVVSPFDRQLFAPDEMRKKIFGFVFSYLRWRCFKRRKPIAPFAS
jgi:hypothetical protein